MEDYRIFRYIRKLSEEIPLALPAVFSIVNVLLCHMLAGVPFLMFIVPVFLFLILFSALNYKLNRILIPVLVILLITTVSVAETCIFVSDYEGAEIGGEVVSKRYRLSGDCQIIVDTEAGNVMLTLPYEASPVLGETVNFDNGIDRPSIGRNPGDFSYSEYLETKGILYTSRKGVSTVCEANAVNRLMDRISRISFDIKSFVLDLINPDEADRGVVAAVFFGDTSLLDSDTRDEFRMADCSHLLAVSGTHFMGFLMGVPYVLDKLKVSKRMKYVIYGMLCIMLGMFTGWSESVTRAAIMSFCAYCSREYYSGMSLAVLIMVISNPLTPLSMGFQMSFMASLGIKLFSGVYVDKLTKAGMGESLAGILSSTFAAQTGMIPFWCSTGMYLSPIHLAVQILASTVTGFACVLFVPTVLFAFLFPESLFVIPLNLLIKLIRFIVSITSDMTDISVNTARLSPLLILFVFILLISILFLPLRKYLLIIGLSLLALGIGTLIGDYFYGPKCEVVFIDVGQGNSCLIKSDGYTCLIDGGVYEAGSTIETVLDYYGIGKVDYAIGTHWDYDHFGGIGKLWEDGRVRTVYNSIENINDETQSFCDDYFSGREGCSIGVLRSGMTIKLSRDVVINVLSPTTVQDGGNEDSLVLCLEVCGECRCLFTGDIGIDTENNLVDTDVIHRADILSVGHHGSRYSTGERLLDYMVPDLAIISSGINNSYGHPHIETLERLENRGVGIYNTQSSGAVVIQMYDDYYDVKPFINDNQ